MQLNDFRTADANAKSALVLRLSMWFISFGTAAALSKPWVMRIRWMYFLPMLSDKLFFQSEEGGSRKVAREEVTAFKQLLRNENTSSSLI